ncbi:DUF6931 family protein [Thalassomonas haliotis]|uniref:Twin-arginine translocation pathway signal n=1 Tax=Thalassomonas haliotis TaxID=485448 RepID=A0ABY7VE29_9GAMM|nr:Twin-arginine translocation pathway signal [Thalassomonas haliotis]WDE11974.1 hypothetical protein H3N35_00330 [Thalassomonas haliotis]
MLKKIPNKNVASIISRYQLSDEAKALLTPELTPEAAIALLQEQELYNDVVQFIAHALPVVEAIGWASDAMDLRQADWTRQEVLAINAARNWLGQPNETLRIRASQLADRVGLECAPGWVAKAVFWSGTGSIVEPDLPAVMPPPFLYGHAAAAAITIAAAVPQWEHYQKFYQQVIELGIQIANGKGINSQEMPFAADNTTDNNTQGN